MCLVLSWNTELLAMKQLIKCQSAWALDQLSEPSFGKRVFNHVIWQVVCAIPLYSTFALERETSTLERETSTSSPALVDLNQCLLHSLWSSSSSIALLLITAAPGSLLSVSLVSLNAWCCHRLLQLLHDSSLHLYVPCFWSSCTISVLCSPRWCFYSGLSVADALSSLLLISSWLYYLCFELSSAKCDLCLAIFIWSFLASVWLRWVLRRTGRQG